jgi:Tol biopolymer transport system component
MRPSHELHGNARWFLLARWTTEVLADGLWARKLIAIREDGREVVIYDQAGARIRTRAWAKDDSFMSFTIVRPGDGSSAIVRATVDWSSGDPAIGDLDTVVVGSFDTSRNVNSLGAHSWSPDGGAVVYAERDVSQAPPASAPQSIYVRDLGLGTTEDLGLGTAPKWSADGFSIAFDDSGAVLTMSPDGSGVSVVTTDGRGPEWSPDGEHIIALRAVTEGKGKRKTTADEVIRMLATGGEEKNITSEVIPDTAILAWR